MNLQKQFQEGVISSKLEQIKMVSSCSFQEHIFSAILSCNISSSSSPTMIPFWNVTKKSFALYPEF